MGEGTGTFIRLDDETIIRNGHIISFGDFHMAIGFLYEKA